MKPKHIAALVATTATLAAQAAVTPIGPGSNVFLDAAHGLLWSQPDAFAANNFASAEAAVSAATIEGFSDWYLPSLQQFRWLYQTQGTVPTGNPNPDYDEIMVEAPFSGMLPTWYWTTDVDAGNTARNVAFSPTNANTDAYFRTTPVNVWAVHDYTAAIPEPGSALLAGLGLAVIAVFARRSGASRDRPAQTR